MGLVTEQLLLLPNIYINPTSGDHAVCFDGAHMEDPWICVATVPHMDVEKAAKWAAWFVLGADNDLSSPHNDSADVQPLAVGDFVRSTYPGAPLLQVTHLLDEYTAVKVRYWTEVGFTYQLLSTDDVDGVLYERVDAPC